MGAIGLIAEECPAEHVRRHIEIIEAGYDGAAGLINRLLTFSRRQVVEPTILDLNSVITDVTSMLGRLIGEDIDLRTSLASRLGTIYADRNQMEQIVISSRSSSRRADVSRSRARSAMARPSGSFFHAPTASSRWRPGATKAATCRPEPRPF